MAVFARCLFIFRQVSPPTPIILQPMTAFSRFSYACVSFSSFSAAADADFWRRSPLILVAAVSLFFDFAITRH